MYMAKSLLALIFVFTIYNTRLCFAKANSTWVKTEPYGHEQKTTLQFYFHETAHGKAQSLVKIAQRQETNLTSNPFGELYMADNPITVSPDPNSLHVGQAQGMYGVASKEELSLIMALTYNFVEGVYNGSSISLLCRNPIMESIREFPVVGGTGLFRMARGYALAQTYLWNHDTGIVIVGYNVTVFHP
ncbi:dirigent protein 23-like [Amaranthus tricolor]|uniref:dirigent protein 23-like n=1 Tax=Amaranthus tricolor TaxID=29722 RepID=UPI002584722D|nr:dirigent protein 23-like [Amaranthus tricolor]